MKSSARAINRPSLLRIKHKVIVDIASSLFILLFIYTGINKLIEIDKLKLALVSYPLISAMSSTIAWSLPIIEIIIAILLFIPSTKLLGLYSAGILMTLFTLYVMYLLAFTPNLPCTCGGMLTQLSWTEHLIFNIFFVGLAVLGIRSIKLDSRQI